MSVDIANVVARLVEGRAAGEALPEPEAQQITAALGIGVPPMVVAASPDDASEAALEGDRVVVKAIGAAHKTDVGGVRVVDNEPEAIRAAAAALDGSPVLVAGFVPHDVEVLAGVRWTDAFGAVVTIGLGGVGVEEGSIPAFITAGTRQAIEESLGAAPGSRGLVDGARGGPPPVAVDQLADLAVRLLDLGEAVMPRSIGEFEMNPVAFTSEGPVALDALAVVGGSGALVEPRPTGGIATMLEPESIAVIGVSEQMNPGHMIVRNILAAGFPAEDLTIVKPGRDDLDGCRCVASVTDLGEVDLLVVAVAAAAVEEVVAEAVGVTRSMILIPGGVGERPGTEEAATRIRRAIRAAPPGSRPVVTGPNSMGVRSTRFDATFIPGDRMTPSSTEDHPVAVVAQSGAFTLSRLDRLPWLRARHVVTVGNQIDLTVGDFLRFFADDPQLRVVAAYVEGLAPGDGTAALEAAAEIRARDGVLLWYRAGRTRRGARTAATHTAAIATDDRIAGALASVAGILEAGSLDDFDDLLRLATRFDGRPVGPAVGVLSNAGFECVAAADALGGMALADLSPATVSRIDTLFHDTGLAGFAGAANPVDLTPIAGDEVFAAAVEPLLDDAGVAVAVIGCVPYSPAVGMLAEDIDRPESLVERLALLAGHPTPWVAVIDAGRRYDAAAVRLEEAGIPVIRSMDRAVRLLDRYVACRRSR